VTQALAIDDVAATLLAPATIRERSANVLAAADAGRSRHFIVDRGCFDAAATCVEKVTRSRYPTLDIPPHSRWRHFGAGGVDRCAELDRALAGRDATAAARSRIDLAVVSVLLDAGAGPAWAFVERESGARCTRSEGLAVASFRAFMAGGFSARRDDPLRVDAAALAEFDARRLARWFQVDAGNPLVGLDERASLMRRLGGALAARTDVFGDRGRPGGLLDVLVRRGRGGAVDAASLLRALLDGLGAVWPSGSSLHGVALGDAWRHPHSGGRGPTAGWVPFHKLSQWLVYSLLEPFAAAGAPIAGQDVLTALPEYRNGGLLVDSGVLRFRADVDTSVPRAVGDELIVEWRALTVALIDELAPKVRARLGLPRLPLAGLLEGGTWAAGRELAQALRGGAPPISVLSDGTVF
jgi:hypothetical protein